MNNHKSFFTLLAFMAILISESNCQEFSWKSIGPWMGYVENLAMDMAKPDTVYAATPYGLHKTVNGAVSWERISLPVSEINRVTVSQSDPNNILYANEFRVYKSTDFGQTWDTIWSDTMRIMCIVYNPYNPGTIFIGTNEQQTTQGWEWEALTKWIYRSTDGGQSWEIIPFSGVDESDRPEKVKYIIIDPADTTQIYVGTENSNDGGFFLSRDNGASWEVKRMNSFGEEVKAMACTPADYENHTLCAIEGAGMDRKFLVSKDSGSTWTNIDFSSNIIFGRNIRDNAMFIPPDYPEWVYIGAEYSRDEERASVVCYNLEDEGWYYLPGTPNANPTTILTCYEADYLGFRYDGFYKYTVSGSDTGWFARQNGMNCGEVYDVAVNPEDPDKIFAAIRSQVARSIDGGDSWHLTDRDFSALAISEQDTGFILGGHRPPYYLSYMSSFYYYTGEAGGTDWEGHHLFTRMGLSEYDYKMWTGDILIFPSDPDKFIFGIDGGGGAGEGIYITEDGGSSWLVNFGAGVSTLAQDPNDENTVYLGTTGLGYVSRSTQGGKDWVRISPGGQDAFVHDVWDLAVDKNSKVFAATSEGLFTWEGGETWTRIEGLPAIPAKAIVIDNHLSSPVYYVGTEEQGVFCSEDGGETWHSFNDGLGTLNINKLKINNSLPRNLYAATRDGGVWLTTLQESALYTSGIRGEEISIHVFPNPSQGSFSVASNADSELSGELKLINLLGKVVYTERHIHIPPGAVHSISISNIVPGNYILVFTSEKLNLNRKLIITRDQP